ncbi:hypothetical protein NADE_005010 [Nannochloris sp. 'desiccata']|nr:hypothetical protein NADE_005010 [Chlorella desiccata (nom. nud.)]
MGTKAASFDDCDAKTPSSLASPRDPVGLNNDQTPTTLLRAAAQLASSTAPDSPRTPPAAYVLHDLWLAARHTRRDAEGLHGVLQIVQGHIHDLQQELLSVTAEMERQEQAHGIKMMKKQCEIRLLEAESTAYSMAAMARTATVASLQRSTDDLLAEREVNSKALATTVAELEKKTTALQAAEAAAESSRHRNLELESLLEKLQLELDISKERLEKLEMNETQHEATKILLDAAQADASSAAGQLVDACEENAKLSDALGMLQVELEQRDVEVSQLREENNELKASLQQQGQQRKSLGASRRVQVAVRTHMNPAFETPGSVDSTATTNNRGTARAGAAMADQDDLLAIEVSRLRLHTEELEMQLAESKNAAPVLATLQKEAGMLRKENTALKLQVDHATLETAEAQRELHQVQSEARVLHGQLSEVISSLAGAGLAGSPVGLLQSYLAPSEQQEQLLTLPSSSASGDAEEDQAEQEKAVLVVAAAVEGANRKGPLVPSVAMQGTPSIGLHSATSFSRGPPTPTWPTPPPAASTACGIGDRPGSGSNTSGGGSDLILAELRSAMAQLDSVTALEGGVEAASQVGKKNLKGPPSPPAATATAISLPTGTATDILESISRGIAALGGGNDDNEREQQIYDATSTMSSSEGAATVAPRS